MPERLSELQRQRALVQAHLAWLDGEIAAAAGRAEPTVPLPPAATPAAPDPAAAARPAPPPDPAAGTTEAEADALLKQYGHDPAATTSAVKRGCWIVFVGAFVALGGAILLWVLLRPQP